MISKGSTIYPGTVLVLLGAVLSYFGYLANFYPVSPNEVLGPALFWIGVCVFLFAYPLRGAVPVFSRTLRRPLGLGTFAAYLFVHLLLYGFILDGIFSSIYGAGALSESLGFSMTTNVFLPPSALATAFDLAYNPSITLSLPPVFGVALSFYGVAVAVIIAVLILANVGRTMDLGGLCTRARRARSYVALPALGIVLGASCCISVAGVVALAVPAVAALTQITWIYYTTYFLFPSLAVAFLYLNLRSIEKISAAVRASMEGRADLPAAG